jgi:hypothetical protein
MFENKVLGEYLFLGYRNYKEIIGDRNEVLHQILL